MSITITGGFTLAGGGWTVVPAPPSYKAIFGYGTTSGNNQVVSMTNLVSNTGVVATDTTGVGTARGDGGAASYGLA
jgi:hypothetical protein